MLLQGLFHAVGISNMYYAIETYPTLNVLYVAITLVWAYIGSQIEFNERK